MKANKTSSKKAKGSRLEKLVASEIRRKGIDKEARRMILSGASYLKGDVWCPNIPYQFECKNNERHNIWKEWEQTEDQCQMNSKPILVISGNYRPALCVLKLDDLLNLIKIEKEN